IVEDIGLVAIGGSGSASFGIVTALASQNQLLAEPVDCRTLARPT
ncbi:type II and III secretion system protein, partial [Pseudoalteromonas spongiae]